MYYIDTKSLVYAFNILAKSGNYLESFFKENACWDIIHGIISQYLCLCIYLYANVCMYLANYAFALFNFVIDPVSYATCLHTLRL